MHADRPRRCTGFTVIDLMAVGVVLVILVVLVLVLLPMLGNGRRGPAREMANNTQLRGIHQSFVTFAQSNKRGGNDGFFPGLDSTGMIIPNGPDTGHSGDGTQPGARLWMLLEGNYFTPEYIINPADAVTTEVATDPATGEHRPLTADHYSYALSAITATPPTADPDGRTAEWKETLNTAAIMLGDRRPSVPAPPTSAACGPPPAAATGAAAWCVTTTAPASRPTPRASRRPSSLTTLPTPWTSCLKTRPVAPTRFWCMKTRRRRIARSSTASMPTDFERDSLSKRADDA